MRTRMLGMSRHSFYATADAVGAGGENPPATRLSADFFILTIAAKMCTNTHYG